MYSITKNNIQEENNLYFSITQNSTNEKTESVQKWNLEIPKIDLNAQIVNGVGSEILNQNIGHFEDTGIIDQNICLAAHNRGYDKNYFEKIHLLQKGDEIIYYYENKKYIYIVESNFIIEETNLEVLENRGIDEMTLITCVANKANLRRCIKALKVKE